MKNAEEKWKVLPVAPVTIAEGMTSTGIRCLMEGRFDVTMLETKNNSWEDTAL